MNKLLEKVAQAIATKLATYQTKDPWYLAKAAAQEAIPIVLEEVVTVVFQQVPDSPRLVELVVAIRALGDSHD